MTEPLDALAEGHRRLAEGREAIALEHFVVAAEEGATAEDRHEALARCAEINIALGRPFEAVAWTERLRREAPRRERADLLEAVAVLRTGDPARALELLAAVGDATDASAEYRPTAVAVVRAQALGQLQRHAEAMAELAAAVRLDATDPDVWTTLATLAAHPDADPAPVVDALPAGSGFAETLGRLVDADAAGADRVLDALWQRSPGDSRALVLLGYLGSRLGVERALTWSGRLRAHGRGDDCPLLGIAASPDREPLDRVRAASVAWATFADPRAGALLDLAATALLDRDLPAALQDVGTLAADLAGDFLVAAATTPSRALVLARALVGGGVADTAVALLRHGVELANGHPAQLTGAVAQTLSMDDVEALAATADEHGAVEAAQALRAAA